MVAAAKQIPFAMCIAGTRVSSVWSANHWICSGVKAADMASSQPSRTRGLSGGAQARPHGRGPSETVGSGWVQERGMEVSAERMGCRLYHTGQHLKSFWACPEQFAPAHMCMVYKRKEDFPSATAPEISVDHPDCAAISWWCGDALQSNRPTLPTCGVVACVGCGWESFVG